MCAPCAPSPPGSWAVPGPRSVPGLHESPGPVQSWPMMRIGGAAGAEAASGGSCQPDSDGRVRPAGLRWPGPDGRVLATEWVRTLVVDTKNWSPVKDDAVTSARSVMQTLGEGRRGCALCRNDSDGASASLLSRIRQLGKHNRSGDLFHNRFPLSLCPSPPTQRTVLQTFSPRRPHRPVPKSPKFSCQCRLR